MSTQEKIVLSDRNVDEFLAENFNRTDFVSTMSDEERARIIHEATALWGVDDEKALEISDRIPVSPGSALYHFVTPGLGREFLLDGFNLADVEKAFGKDWLDRFETEYERRKRYMAEQA